MAFLELVQHRQSTRQFAAEKPVPRELILRCLEAARLAPSASNSQPWTFIIVDGPPQRERLAAGAFSGVYAINAFARKAPVLVAIVSERSRPIARLGGMLHGVRFRQVDEGIAGEHFVLAAAELGLGTCWLGWFSSKAVRRVLNLPRRTRVDLMIALGYPAEDEAPRPKARRSLEDMSRFV